MVAFAGLFVAVLTYLQDQRIAVRSEITTAPTPIVIQIPALPAAPVTAPPAAPSLE
jgi:hypothetical protein